MKWLVAALASLVRVTLGSPDIYSDFVYPPNPLGGDCLKLQFEELNNQGYDSSSIDVPENHAIDPEDPAKFLVIARNSLRGEWERFQSSICRGRPDDNNRAGWAGNCRSVVSTFRDALSIFAAIYPPGGYGTQYEDDKWEYIQNLTHDGYHDMGDFGDEFGACQERLAKGQACSEGSRQIMDETFGRLHEWWESWGDIMGYNGQKRISDIPKAPTWNEYIRLDENALIGPQQQKWNESSVMYTKRWMTRQFWGYNEFAKPYYGCYENLGYLMQTQMETALGEDDAQYYKVIGFENIANIDNPLSGDETIKYATHEQFHDLRKQLRAMWNTHNSYPEIMPLAWASTVVPGVVPSFNLWDASRFRSARLGNGQGEWVRNLMFQNSESSRRKLLEAGWDYALIELGTAMALGGFYVDKQDCSNDVACEANIDMNVICDWPSRMGCINDLFMTWKVLKESGDTPQAELDALQEKMNALWVRLKSWMEENKLLELQHAPINYLPWRQCGIEPHPGPTAAPEPTTAQPTRSPTPLLPPPHSSVPIVVVDTGKFLKIPLADKPRQDASDVEAAMTVFGSYPLNGEISTNSPSNSYAITIKDRLSPIMRERNGKRMFQMTCIDSFSSPTHTPDEKDCPLLGMPEGEDWYLVGANEDLSLLRVPLASELSNAIGLWSPRVRQVELYLVEDKGDRVNFYDHYQGVYNVMERIKRQDNRIEVKKQKEGRDYEDAGYILAIIRGKKDKKILGGADGLTGGRFSIEYPTKDVKNATEFIEDFLELFEEALWNNNTGVKVEDWHDGGEENIGDTSGYERYINVASFVDFFLVTELMGSVDAYSYNTYMYYDGDKNKKNGHTKRMHMGPPFFSEFSLGNVGNFIGPDGGSWYKEGWRYESRVRDNLQDPAIEAGCAHWFARLMSDPYFKQQVVRRWATLRMLQWSDENIAKTLESLRKNIEEVAGRNYELWRSKERSGRWEYEVETLQSWLGGRLAWMDAHLISAGRPFHSITEAGSTCDVPGVPLRRRQLLEEEVAQTPSMKVHQRSPLQWVPPAPWVPCPTDCDGTDPLGGLWDNYPQCQPRMDYLKAGSWKDHKPEIDGTTCSMQKFLHNENVNYCPAACKPGCDTGDCMGPYNTEVYPKCVGSMRWVMDNYWSDPKFEEGGIVNGTSCEVQSYLHFENKTHPICPNPCQAPTPAPTLPPSTGSPTTPPPPTLPPTYPVAPPPTTTPRGPVATDSSCFGDCVGPWPHHPYCHNQVIRYETAADGSSERQELNSAGADGSLCSIQRFLHQRNGVCPEVPDTSELECIYSICQNPKQPTVHPDDPVYAPTPAGSGGGSGEGASTKSVGIIFGVLAAVAVAGGAFIFYQKRTRALRESQSNSRLSTLLGPGEVRSDTDYVLN